MKKFANLLRQEQGLTLIELLVSLVLFSMLALLVSTVMMFGFRSYHKVSVENKLRDEGDLLMSSVITELYTFGPDTVAASKTINPDSKERETSIILTRINSEGGIDKVQISIANQALYIKDIPLKGPSSSTGIDARTAITSKLGPESAIELECNINQTCESGLVHVKLQLISPGDDKGKGLSLESNFGF